VLSVAFGTLKPQGPAERLEVHDDDHPDDLKARVAMTKYKSLSRRVGRPMRMPKRPPNDRAGRHREEKGAPHFVTRKGGSIGPRCPMNAAWPTESCPAAP